MKKTEKWRHKGRSKEIKKNPVVPITCLTKTSESKWSTNSRKLIEIGGLFAATLIDIDHRINFKVIIGLCTRSMEDW